MDAYLCFYNSYNLYTPPRPMALSPAARLSPLHFNPRSSLSNKSILASPSPPPHQTIPTILLLVSNQTIASR